MIACTRSVRISSTVEYISEYVAQASHLPDWHHAFLRVDVDSTVEGKYPVLTLRGDAVVWIETWNSERRIVCILHIETGQHKERLFLDLLPVGDEVLVQYSCYLPDMTTTETVQTKGNEMVADLTALKTIIEGSVPDQQQETS